MPKTASRNSSQAHLVASREVYTGPLFRVTRDEVIEPSGVHVRRDIVRHTGSVVILAIEENGREPRILLERQYRHAAQSYLWELPAGRIDEGEKALAAAKRELKEETGYIASRWKQMKSSKNTWCPCRRPSRWQPVAPYVTLKQFRRSSGSSISGERKSGENNRLRSVMFLDSPEP